MSLRKRPRTNKQNPPRKQRKIHDLPRPSTVKDKRIAMNHSSRANFRIIGGDYTSPASPKSRVIAVIGGFSPKDRYLVVGTWLHVS